jgi:ribosomal protein L11 methyltransferase
VLRLAIRVHADQAELVLAELLELAPGGVEEVEVQGGGIEYAVYGPPGELPALPDLTAAAGDALIEVSSSELPDDWADRWRVFHRPLVLEGSLTVRPPWEPTGNTPLDIVIDPAQAFGTGAHHTTRLCLELLLDIAGPGASAAPGDLVDLGCGSGVLAIAAAKLGFSPVFALDCDPLSVAATSENAARNGVELQIARHDLRSDPPACGRTVTANLLAPLLSIWGRRLAEAGLAPGRVIASGLLGHEADAVAGEFAAVGMHETARRLGGEWAALLLEAG